jgi:hypothetical protein
VTFNMKTPRGEWTADFEKRTTVREAAAAILFAPGAQFGIDLRFQVACILSPA